MSTERQELLAAVTELSTRQPQWRLGQLVANVAGWADRDIWDVEDAELLDAVRLHLQHAADRALESCN